MLFLTLNFLNLILFHFLQYLIKLLKNNGDEENTTLDPRCDYEAPIKYINLEESIRVSKG